MKDVVIDFSFSDKKTGQDILNFCNDSLKQEDINSNVYHMLNIIKSQIQRSLDN